MPYGGGTSDILASSAAAHTPQRSSSELQWRLAVPWPWGAGLALCVFEVKSTARCAAKTGCLRGLKLKLKPNNAQAPFVEGIQFRR
jgi:hypothetical protein